MQELRGKILALDGASYKQYKTLQGEYTFPGFVLSIDHVQGDPFADPSRISVHVSHEVAGLPDRLWSSPIRQAAAEDFLARQVERQIHQTISRCRGSGRSGEIGICANRQQVLRRNCLLLSARGLEARLQFGLPAAGRAILAADAERVLCDELPRVVEAALYYTNLRAVDFDAHVKAIENQADMRTRLNRLGLVAFLADGSRLARRSGIDDRPLDENTIPLKSPDTLAIEMKFPDGEIVRGLGIPQGVTVIVGGGFHGKSTLLQAIERGVYNHVPGDGRERVVTLEHATKVRAEDGRSVANLDISGFVNHLPFNRDTVSFTTDNASGSTSQAANIIEALHGGSGLLLIDEDTSATNFMIRDGLMQRLVPDDKEPITPFLHRVRELSDRYGVSSVIVMGGSGDYLSVADTVLMMDNYQVLDATGQAHALTHKPPVRQAQPPLSLRSNRRPELQQLSATRNNKIKIAAHKTRELIFGAYEVDVSKLAQLVDRAQLEAIGWLLEHYASHADPDRPAAEALADLINLVHDQGLDRFTPYKRMGNFAVPRLQELHAVLNRMRGLRWLD